MATFKRKILSILIVSLMSLSFYAQEDGRTGGEVMSMGQIDDLIELTDYSNALYQLSLYINKYPEQFDKAQKRISKIMKARGKFNSQAVELAEKMRLSAEGQNLTDEQINDLDNQKMDIIIALEKSEENPAAEEVALTNDARRTVKLSYYINKSNVIVNQGTALVAGATLESDENYNDAAVKFKEGLTLKTNDSDIVFQGDEEIPVVYPASLNKNVDTHIAAIKNYSLSIKKSMDDCQSAYEAYGTAVKNNSLTEAQEALKNLKSAFEKLASVRNAIYREGLELRRLDEQALSLNPGLGDTSYITFSRWAVLGVESNPDSGLIGAIDAFWNTRVESLKEIVFNNVRSNYQTIASSLAVADGGLYTASDFTGTAASRQNAGDFALQGKDVQGLYGLITDCAVSKFKEFNTSMDFASAFSRTSMRSLLSLSRSIITQNEEVAKRKVVAGNYDKFGADSIASAVFYERQLTSLNEYKNSKSVNDQRLREEKAKTQAAQENSEETSRRTTAGILVEDKVVAFDEEIKLYDDIIVASEKECNSQAANVWGVIASTYSEEADRQLLAFTLRNADAQNLLNGVEEETNGIKAVKFYPTKASEQCQKLNSDIQKQRNILTQYRITLDGGSAYKDSETPYASGVANIERVIAALNELVVSNNQVIAQAKIKSNEALKASNKAKQSYDQAVKNLNKNRYEEARAALDSARESYLQSLALEENDAFRRQFGPLISQTDEEITVKQNEWVITTVRQLITDAYNDYYGGNFENSKRNLDEATTVWEKTQINANSEIEELMTLVVEALESTGGKEIAFSDPLYKDMGAYLNNASIHYEEGAKLYNEGKNEEGLALLTQARDEVRKVQRVFPKNLEANNLTLRINKIMAPEVYESTVAEKIKKAKTQAASQKDIDQKNALNDLKELQSVIGSTPALKAAIKEVETTIARSAQSEKIKADQARSVALTKQAQNEPNLTKKLALLDEALALNRRNTLAQSLKDKALTSKTASGKTTVKNYLEDYDEPIYAQAERYYNDGRKDEALKIINDLYRRNPQVPKVAKLKRRIENM